LAFRSQNTSTVNDKSFVVAYVSFWC